MPAAKPCIAIVIGTGAPDFRSDAFISRLTDAGLTNLHDVRDLNSIQKRRPFGDYDCTLDRYECDQGSIIIVRRHGLEHGKPPSALNFPAMFHALKLEGVTHYWATTAVGSLREEIEPGTLVLARDYVDPMGCGKSFFRKKGPAIHMSMAQPTCPCQDTFLQRMGRDLGIEVRQEGDKCMIIKGPEFSTKAESELWKSWGLDLVGMTMAREAKLARACGFHASWLCLACDYDAWHDQVEAVTAEMVEAALPEMVDKASHIFVRGLRRVLVTGQADQWRCQCATPILGAGHSQGNLLKDYPWIRVIGQR